MHKLLIISGPTASGKTALALSLAKKYDGELVNADARQIYEGLSVLTGKDIPPGETSTHHRDLSIGNDAFHLVTYSMEGIPIWLYDAASVRIQVNISAYKKLAVTVIEDIQARAKLPILVGGSGLYINSVIRSIETIDIPPNDHVRAMYANADVPTLQDVLHAADKTRLDSMNSSDKQNPRRLMRAIEVALWQKEHTTSPATSQGYDVFWVGLRPPEGHIQPTIHKRVEERWTDAVDEVRHVLGEQYSNGVITSLGVTPIVSYLNRECSSEEAKKLWQQSEVSYAKRQMTWFAKQSGIVWFNAQGDTLERDVEKRIDTWYTEK
jgi:tRNA dimethylallyltransferase